MKYFILKPRSKYYFDPHALASREAMRLYAFVIRDRDIDLANSLLEWIEREEKNNDKLIREHMPLDTTRTSEDLKEKK